MNSWFSTLVLFADPAAARAVAETFRGERVQFQVGNLLLGAAALLTVVAVFWGGTALQSYLARNQQVKSPRGLFNSLCRQHGLDWTCRRALWRLAREHHRAQPARIFLRPELLDQKLASNKRPAQSATYQQLRQRLFGDLADAI